MSVQNKKLGVFGTFSWNGGGVKNLLKFAADIKWEQVSDSVEFKGIPAEDDYLKCDTIALSMAQKVKNP
jgi:flavorubredoxin